MALNSHSNTVGDKNCGTILFLTFHLLDNIEDETLYEISSLRNHSRVQLYKIIRELTVKNSEATSFHIFSFISRDHFCSSLHFFFPKVFSLVLQHI